MFKNIVYPEYRLSPEHRFPAAFNDSLDTIIYVDKNAEKYGIDRTWDPLTRSIWSDQRQ